ncbi:serine/arginine repetitive matrix protein 1-like isoform X2 [Bacillus rossius redtenbacheri]|uniref:serine/arginine repetitive matrix protein 1-like isoform X2 n=1 Tax=Bacillus rossius redtenbacheri TaxID=93214 RepID=UPI002FDEAE7C
MLPIQMPPPMPPLEVHPSTTPWGQTTTKAEWSYCADADMLLTMSRLETTTLPMPLQPTQPQPTLPLQMPPPTSPPPADQWIAGATSGNIVSETTHCETAESTPYHAVVITPPPPTPPPPTAVKAHSGLTRCKPAVLPRPPEDKTTQDHLEELPRRRRPRVLRKLLARNGITKRRFCNTLKGISHLSSHSQSTRRHLHPSHVPLKALPHRRGPPRAPPGAHRRLTQKAATHHCHLPRAPPGARRRLPHAPPGACRRLMQKAPPHRRRRPPRLPPWQQVWSARTPRRRRTHQVSVPVQRPNASRPCG